MKKISFFSLLVLLFAIVATSASAADTQGQTDEERCNAYAKEDNVPAAEMADFMKDCLESIKSDSEENKDKKD
ncbi:MAG: hypothetical protein OQK19_05930 [Sedimenticola sp.]|uniref:Uncharacterized protein n=1 Tax=Sedimenticola thiotaurini TaxID=1543721 RepID=A0A558CSK5_9GAMM|nr:hypothetical protein [Sedimenticola sp.]TVT51750.1 MAG: hypothetical protein FHK82_15020 [Sedimenticola thiotaurini]MCW8882625.1 hypothetical protein [Sedimenticola sp.]MCW8950277.1 hypothetical protein [Sedimenticola sp.]MCW8976618.1 hypothetical protein [Sedimenticola sp.]